MGNFEIIGVNESNVDQTGFFCAMSNPGSLGYQAKLEWLRERFREGLKLKMITRGGRGFIEYIPGEFAWRAIDARGYMVVHCLWVVGREKNQGCGTALLEECIHDAKSTGMLGVAAVSAVREAGLSSTGFYLKNGFQLIDTAPPALDLVALKFYRNAPNPRFTGGWDRKVRAAGPELTVVYSHQCPYIYEGLDQLGAMAEERGLSLGARNLRSAEEVRNEAPSAYGTFAMCCGDQVLAHLPHHGGTRKLMRRVEQKRLALAG